MIRYLPIFLFTIFLSASITPIDVAVQEYSFYLFGWYIVTSFIILFMFIYIRNHGYKIAVAFSNKTSVKKTQFNEFAYKAYQDTFILEKVVIERIFLITGAYQLYSSFLGNSVYIGGLILFFGYLIKYIKR